MAEGMILKALSGFYYVDDGTQLFACRGRGKFRHEKVTPLVGDRVLFAPLDLRFAKKSGRVSAAAAFMGEALGLKPVMTFEGGDSKVLTKVRGEKNVIPTLLEMCQKTREPNTPYLVIRAGNPEQAERMIDACAQTLGQPADLIYEIGGVIAINAGPNLVGMIYREK